ncbi:MAG: hypothetical protein H5T64_13530 [Chloroflexi bacterium]|nr:hypothetical protein [Chloroflexota bacterium]
MNLFNRIVVVLLLLLMMAFLVLTVVLPDPVLTTIAQGVSQIRGNFYVYYRSYLLGAVPLFFICLVLLYLEVRRTGRDTVRITQVSGAQVEMTTSSIARSLDYEIGKLPDVLKVKPIVISKGKGVVVRLDLETTPDIHVPAKMQEVAQVAREAIEDKMGVKLLRIAVNITQAPYARVEEAVAKARIEMPPPPIPPAGEQPPFMDAP